MTPDPEQLVADCARGDQEALRRALPLVYERVRQLAGGLLAADRAG